MVLAVIGLCTLMAACSAQEVARPAIVKAKEILNRNEQAVEASGTNDTNVETADEANRYWANQVLEGGYILYFRHAQREKWNDVTVFDAREVLMEQNGRAQPWFRAVCLSDQGLEEAKGIGWVFTYLDIAVDQVISSPVCRALETAQLAWGGATGVDLSILHPSAIPKEQHAFFANRLASTLKRLKPQRRTVAVVSGHGNTLKPYQSEVFTEVSIPEANFEINEGGFFVIENLNGRLYLRHAFVNFFDFANQLLVYPQD